MLKFRSGHTTRQHKVNLQRQLPTSLEHIVDPLNTTHICNFVGVGNNGGSTVGYNRFRKLSRRSKRGLNMHVSIYQPGYQIASMSVDLFHPFIGTDTDYHSIVYGQISLDHFMGKDVHYTGPFKNQFRPFPAGGNIYSSLHICFAYVILGFCLHILSSPIQVNCWSSIIYLMGYFYNKPQHEADKTLKSG